MNDRRSNPARRRPRLRKESLRVLDVSELDEVRGGGNENAIIRKKTEVPYNTNYCLEF